MTLLLVLARRLARNKKLAASTLIVTITSAVLIVLFTSISSVGFSDNQEVSNQLGRYGASIAIAPGVEPGLKVPVDKFVSSLERRGVTDSTFALASTSIRATEAEQTRLYYIEADWADTPFPDRYGLKDGRWPSKPNEIAVSNRAELPITSDQEILFFSGAATFTVVGTIDSSFSEVPQVVAAPGTWDSLDPTLSRRFTTTDASGLIYVPEAQAPLLVEAAEAAGSDYRNASTTLITASTIRADAEPTWIDRIPAGYTIPSILVPMAAALAVLGVNLSHLRRTHEHMARVGVNSRRSASAICVALTGWLLAAAVLGTTLGVLASLVFRIPLRYLKGTELGPVPDISGPAFRIVVSTIIAGAIAGYVVGHEVRDSRRRRSTGIGDVETKPRRLTSTRRTGAALLAIVVVVQVPGLDSPEKAMFFAGSLAALVVALAPEAISLSLRHYPERSAVTRLVRRRLQIDHGRAMLAVVTLAIILGLPLGILTIVSTGLSTLRAESTTEVAVDQVMVTRSSANSGPPTAEQRIIVADALGTQYLPAQLRIVTTEEDELTMSTMSDGFGLVWALDNVAKVEILLNRTLTDEETTTLADGGILTWADPVGGSEVLVEANTSGESQPTVSPKLPAAQSEAPATQWKASSAGVLLTSTSTSLGLTTIDAGILYGDVAEEDATEARTALIAAGQDARSLRTYIPTPPIVPPVAFVVATLGLIVLGTLTSVILMRAQVHALRPYLATLLTIGVSPRWTRNVLFSQQLFVLGVSTVLAAIIAIVPTLVLSIRVDYFVFDIPWLWMGYFVTSVYLANIVATLIAGRQLTPRSRLHGVQ